MKQYAFGVDIGGTTVKMGLFTSEGELLEKWEIPTRTENDGVNILPDIAESAKKKMEEKGILKYDVIGIGLGVPGPVNDDGVVLKCVNLGWGVINVTEKMTELMDGIPAKAGNDANVAALGEMWKGGGAGHKNVVMVTLGTGVGGGIIINEQIVAGATGAAGEIGHFQMRKDETECCGCGKKGCLEQYASANGIARLGALRLRKDDTPTVLRNADPLTSKDIFDAAKEGDQVALELVEEVGEMLGTALSYIACVTNPEIFVIGGGVSKAGSIVTDTIAKYFRKYAFHASADTPFALAELGNDAGIYGSVKMVL